MIFVTVGTELPFDRLIRVVDRWARNEGRNDVFAQIGEGAYAPTFISYRRFLDASEFRRHFSCARLVVSHAGMGTILTALTSGKPILVMPRSAALNEHRNDHQNATARHMLETGRVGVAFDEHQLQEKLASLERFESRSRISPFAGDELLRTLGQFIHHPDATPAAGSIRPVRALRPGRAVLTPPPAR